MEEWIRLIITGLLAVGASTGFWTFIQHRKDKKDARNKLLIGLAHDRIMYLGSCYIQRGYISKEEYENLNTYLYEPYAEAGGNGSAAKIMLEVNKLPLWEAVYIKDPPKKEIEYDPDQPKRQDVHHS